MLHCALFWSWGGLPNIYNRDDHWNCWKTPLKVTNKGVAPSNLPPKRYHRVTSKQMMVTCEASTRGDQIFMGSNVEDW